MKQHEIVGGLYVSLPIKEKQFLDGLVSYMKKKKLKKVVFHKLSERQQQTATSLIKYNVLDFDGEYIWIRE
jgi:hypothetical protein